MNKILFLILVCISASIFSFAGDFTTSEDSQEYILYVINTENYSKGSFTAGDIITRLNGVFTRGNYDNVMNKMIHLFDSSKNFSGTVIRNGNEISVFEPDIKDFSKSIQYEIIPISSVEISADLVRDDVNVLLSKIRSSYVRYNEKYEKRIQTVLDEVNHLYSGNRLKISVYFRILLEVTAIFDDGHLGVSVRNLENLLIYDFVTNKRYFMPFDLKILNGNYFFEYEGRRYSIHSINGVKIKKLIKELNRIIPCESEGYVESEIEQNLWFYYYILYGNTKEFTIAAYDDNENYFRIKIPGILYSELITSKNSKKDKYQFEILDNTAILTINTFAIDYLSSYGYKNFLEKSFKEIYDKKISKLVIDISENQGGSTESAEYLLRYLTNKPLEYWSHSVVRSSKLARKSGYTFEKDMYDGEIRKYERTPFEVEDTREIQYSGEIFLIIGKKCFSTSLDFIVAFKNAQLGKTIGENTGGTNNSTEQGVYYRLKSDILSFVIPARLYISKGNYFAEDGSLMPDIVCHIPENKSEFYKNLIYLK